MVATVRPPLYMLTVGQEYTAPCPAVVILKDDPHAYFDMQWQFFVRAKNIGLSIHHVSSLYGTNRAFFNRQTGHNYLTGENADQKPPNADKVRSCLRNVITGVEEGDFINVLTFDSRYPPPLKPGRSYPKTVDQIDPDAYLYSPQTHPWLFVVANIINTDGDLVPFPNGALYPWTGDNMPYSFLPLISNHGYGPVLYEKSKVRKLSPTEPIPSPYYRRA